MSHLLLFSFIVFFAVNLITPTAQATEIRMGFYEHDYGRAAGGMNKSEVFILCESCSTRQRLVLKPKTTTLAVRTVQETISVVPGKVDLPEIRSERERAANASLEGSAIRPCRDYMWPVPIYFRFDRFDLSDYETDQLNRLISFMKKNSAREILKVYVTGHTCDMGSRSHNDRLALMRARSVAAYLEGNGFNVSEVKGEGMIHPLSKIRRLNRRVEIEIVH